jgi:hypothetical protein
MVELRYSSTILDLGTRWRRVVSFTPLPLYPRGTNPRYPLDRRQGGPWSLSERCGVKKNLVPVKYDGRTLDMHTNTHRDERVQYFSQIYYRISGPLLFGIVFGVHMRTVDVSYSYLLY